MDDEMYEMYDKNEDSVIIPLKVYGSAFAFVILIILPWIVGVFQLGRWIFF